MLRRVKQFFVYFFFNLAGRVLAGSYIQSKIRFVLIELPIYVGGYVYGRTGCVNECVCVL